MYDICVYLIGLYDTNVHKIVVVMYRVEEEKKRREPP